MNQLIGSLRPAALARNVPASLARDVPASIVVFLVALPLCMGIAIASGVPPEKGLLTGIVGGVLVGLLAGSPLQVSGPAAGLVVLVFTVVQDKGIGMLGPILMLAGLIQLCAGLLRLGRWFRAISPAVVHGMLAGIGVLIVAGQLHVLIDHKPMPNGLDNLAAIPSAFGGLASSGNTAGQAAFGVGALTILAMLGWEKLRPRALRLVPGALVGVVSGTLLAWLAGLPVLRVNLPGAIWASVTVPESANLWGLTAPGTMLTAFAIAFIASAESLLSAAAVDRMHGGVRTDYNRELSAQGVGNMVCGLIGALPMTGVIVRSSANVQAGAATRLSAILHGVWILSFIALLPWLLREVPTASLAGVLVVTGWRLVSLDHVRHLFHRHGPMPAVIWVATLVMVVAVDLLTGVLAGLALSALEMVPHVRRPRLRIETSELAPGDTELHLSGTASFIQLPHLIHALETVPVGRRLQLNASRLTHIDHTCLETISQWAGRWRAAGERVELGAVADGQRSRLAGS